MLTLPNYHFGFLTSSLYNYLCKLPFCYCCCLSCNKESLTVLSQVLPSSTSTNISQVYCSTYEVSTILWKGIRRKNICLAPARYGVGTNNMHLCVVFYLINSTVVIPASVCRSVRVTVVPSLIYDKRMEKNLPGYIQ
jgi:hypothetical protein